MTVGTDLRRAINGPVLEPGDDGFQAASRPWNLAVEQPARAVAEVADADDAAALVRYACRTGIPIAAQPSGHGAAGNTADAIVVRTARLNEIDIRPAERIARVGAGVKWRSVQAETGRHGLTGLPGSSPEVTVTGYTLGGGLSWFGRPYGLAANSVRAFDVVDAEGNPAQVTADSDPELFWALRGGGGDYALVTAIEFDLHPAPSLYGGRVVWPIEQKERVLELYRELTAAASDHLTLWYGLLHHPGGSPAAGIDVTFLGDPAEGERLLSPLDRIEGRLSDTRGPMAIADLGDITGEPTDPSPGMSRTELLLDLDDKAAACLLERPSEPLFLLQVRHLGGALARPVDSAAGHLDEPYAVYLYGPASDAVQEREMALVRALTPYTSGRKPFTVLSPAEPAASAFSAETLERLRVVKTARDPLGVFRSNHPVLD